MMTGIRSILVGLLAAVGLLGIGAPASGKVISGDDPRFGPESITVDLSTGYQWLDVTLSINRSIADVSTQFGVGGDFEGFRYATRDEVITFFQDAGLTGAFGSDQTAVFQALVGVTENSGSPRTVGRVSTQQSPGAYFAPDVTPGSVNPDNCCAAETEASSNAGSWLVRTVVAGDDPRFGPGSVTVDLSTGYQWLDPTLSINRSIADVSAQFGVGGDFEGFRYATQGEVTTFLQNAGLNIGVNFPSAPYQVFLGLVGVTQSGPGSQRTVGRVSTEQSSGQFFAPDVGANGLGGFANPNNCCAAATDANANAGSWLVRTVVSGDDPRFGPGSITIDLSTGNEWLDVTQSLNRSIADVSAQLGVGGDFEGFRYATQAEVITFFQDAGLNIGVNFPSAPYRVFLGLVGVTQSGPGSQRTVGRVLTEQSPGQFFAPDVGDTSGGFANPNNCCAAATDANPNAGSWLVRNPAQPSPPTITAMPANPTIQTSASFSFSQGEAGVSFLCQLDGSAFSVCTSPKSYSGLTQVSHTFSVQATDASGFVSAPATYTWTVDTTGPPTPTITATPANPANQATASFSFSDTEPGVSFLCKLDTDAFTACTSPANYSGLSEAAHTFSVKAQDGAGNQSAPASFAWVIDTTPPPVPTITVKPAALTNQTAASFTFTDSQTDVTFLCQLDGGEFSGCPSPKAYAGLSDAGHSFAVKARDAAGNVSAAASYTWTIDATPPPTPSIDLAPLSPTKLTTATFGFSDGEAGVTFFCKLDTAAFSACTSPKTYTVAQGTHAFSVKAQDPATNQSAVATRSWVVDTTVPPPPTITAKPTNPTSQTGASFSFTDTEAGVTFLCQLDGGAFTPCTSPTGYSGLGEGSHVFSLKAQDAAANQSAAASFTWAIDITPPPTPKITQATVTTTTTRGASFSFTNSQTGVSFLCQMDNAGFSACSPGKSYSGLSQGSHTFSVKSQDTAGNQGPTASFTWTMTP